jgi:hypothetical protein
MCVEDAEAAMDAGSEFIITPVLIPVRHVLTGAVRLPRA